MGGDVPIPEEFEDTVEDITSPIEEGIEEGLSTDPFETGEHFLEETKDIGTDILEPSIEEIEEIKGTEEGPLDLAETVVGGTILGTGPLTSIPGLPEAVGEELGPSVTSTVKGAGEKAGVDVPSLPELEGKVGEAKRKSEQAQKKAIEEEKIKKIKERRQRSASAQTILARRIQAARAAGTTPLGGTRKQLGT